MRLAMSAQPWSVAMPLARWLALILLVSSSLIAVEDPLALLPAIPRPQATAAADLGAMDEIAPGIAIIPGKAVVLNGKTRFDQGPADGLEVIACLDGGKLHESFMVLDTRNAAMINFACLSVLAVKEGQPVPRETGAIPARGVPLRVVVQWPSGDAWSEVDASCLVRDRSTDRPYPPLPYIYTGSRLMAIQETDNDGKLVKVERFMLENTKSLVVNFDEPDALLASPLPNADDDHRWEVYSGLPAPAPHTPARLVLSRATLPLNLRADALGALARDGAVLDDAALAAALGEVFGEGRQPALRAVGIVVPPDSPRENDVGIRTRVLAAAVAAKAWVVPVFVLE
ncbi:MAG TPA: YdjY domain-containing protein [Planctomycetota bacterium]|nr:YdjY domain-containing protein [Planctomycetota bacterium]